MPRQPRLIENLWNCPYCGTVGILGRHEECPHCGRVRQGGTKFYHKEINYVDEETAKTISRNPDWYCSYCDSLNSDDNEFCKGCGSSRESSDKNYFDKLKEKEEDDRKRQEIIDSFISPTPPPTQINNQPTIYGSTQQYQQNSTRTSNNDYNDYKSKLKPTTKSQSTLNLKEKFLSLLGGIGIFSLVVLLIFGMVMLFKPKEKDITITGFEWSRSISIEEFKTVKGEGFSLPIGARTLRTEQRISGYEKVLDHYETKSRQVSKERLTGYEEYVSGYRDLGNGYSEEIISQRPIYETYYETETYDEPVYRDEPIYSTYYFYEEDKWVHKRSVQTNGNDQSPYWGEVVLGHNERKGGNSEHYYIRYIDDEGENGRYSIKYNDWKNLETGQNLKVKVSWGNIVEIIGIETDETNETDDALNVSKITPLFETYLKAT